MLTNLFKKRKKIHHEVGNLESFVLLLDACDLRGKRYLSPTVIEAVLER
jgi:hypothetical protein